MGSAAEPVSTMAIAGLNKFIREGGACQVWADATILGKDHVMLSPITETRALIGVTSGAPSSGVGGVVVCSPGALELAMHLEGGLWHNDKNDATDSLYRAI